MSTNTYVILLRSYNRKHSSIMLQFQGLTSSLILVL